MKVLREGSKGKEVKFLQQRLNTFGFHVGEDGAFGAKTETAVVTFQISRALSADGIVGAQTWTALLVDTEVAVPADLDAAWISEHLTYLDDLKQKHYLGVDGAFPKEMKEDDVAEVVCVLTSAVMQYGLREVPKGSNGGPEIGHIVSPSTRGKLPSDYCIHFRWADTSKMPPWCCIFVSWSLKEGLSAAFGYRVSWEETPFGAWFGSCSHHLEPWARKRKTFVTPSSDDIVPGMIFTLGKDWVHADRGDPMGAAHTGFVLRVKDDGTFDSIEGNASDKVTSVNRKLSSVRIFSWWW